MGVPLHFSPKPADNPDVSASAPFIPNRTPMIENILNSQSATVQKSVFTRRQYTEPLTSGVGSTDVFEIGRAHV